MYDRHSESHVLRRGSDERVVPGATAHPALPQLADLTNASFTPRAVWELVEDTRARHIGVRGGGGAAHALLRSLVSVADGRVHGSAPVSPSPEVPVRHIREIAAAEAPDVQESRARADGTARRRVAGTEVNATGTRTTEKALAEIDGLPAAGREEGARKDLVPL